MEPWYLINLKVKGVTVALRNAPRDSGRYLFFGSINQVKLFIVLQTDNELVRLILNASRYIPICKVCLRQRHQQFKCTFLSVSFQLAKEHTIVATKANL